jgi:hypothetical protein
VQIDIAVRYRRSLGMIPIVTFIQRTSIDFHKDWHPVTWLYLLTGSKYALGLESWGWYIEWTPAFIGSGMLVGMNVAVSFVAGSFLAWYVVSIHLDCSQLTITPGV